MVSNDNPSERQSDNFEKLPWNSGYSFKGVWKGPNPLRGTLKRNNEAWTCSEFIIQDDKVVPDENADCTHINTRDNTRVEFEGFLDKNFYYTYGTKRTYEKQDELNIFVLTKKELGTFTTTTQEGTRLKRGTRTTYLVNKIQVSLENYKQIESGALREIQEITDYTQDYGRYEIRWNKTLFDKNEQTFYGEDLQRYTAYDENKTSTIRYPTRDGKYKKDEYGNYLDKDGQKLGDPRLYRDGAGWRRLCKNKDHSPKELRARACQVQAATKEKEHPVTAPTKKTEEVPTTVTEASTKKKESPITVTEVQTQTPVSIYASQIKKIVKKDGNGKMTVLQSVIFGAASGATAGTLIAPGVGSFGGAIWGAYTGALAAAYQPLI